MSIARQRSWVLPQFLSSRGLVMRHIIAIVYAIGMLAPAITKATTVVAVSEEELTAMADAVVWATVLDMQPYVDQQGFIMTRVRLQVVQGFYGANPGAILNLDVPGGRLASGITTTVSGAPQVSAGDRVFVFLSKHGQSHVALGMSYGLLKGRKDSAGRWRVNRNTEQLTLVDRKGQMVSPASVPVDDELLDDLATRVKAHLEKAHGRGQGAQP
jgi:hypothetical protein